MTKINIYSYISFVVGLIDPPCSSPNIKNRVLLTPALDKIGVSQMTIDECTGTDGAPWLRNHGHEVSSVFETVRGIDRSKPVFQFQFFYAFEFFGVVGDQDKIVGEAYGCHQKIHGADWGTGFLQ